GFELDRRRAGSQDDVPGSELPAHPVRSREFHPPPGQEPAVALKRRDPVRLEERQDALRHGLDDAALALLHLRHVEADARRADAVHRELLLQAVIYLGGLEQLLREDAA